VTGSKAELTQKARILTDLWLNYKNDDYFNDFLFYNDIGLTLAFAYVYDMVTLKPTGEIRVLESYDLLLKALDADTELNYESLEDLLGRYGT
jgi:hypothetical protein